MIKKEKHKNIFSFILIMISVLIIYNLKSVFKFSNANIFGQKLNIDAYNFKLKNTNGEELQLNDFKESYVLLTFGFTECKTTCISSLIKFKSLSNQLHKETDLPFKFIFVSIDDIRDDSKKVTQFINKFKIKNGVGLISGKEKATNVAGKYFNYISFQKEEILKDPDYQILHKDFIYLISPNGKISFIYEYTQLNFKKLIRDINKLEVKI